MKNLLKSEGVSELVQPNDEEGTVAEPNFYFCGGKMYGDLVTLIEWGRQCGLYQSYRQKYSYESIKADFEIRHKRAIEENDYVNAIHFFENFKLDLRQAMHDVIDFEDYSEVRGIEINSTNLKKYVEAYMLDITRYRLEQLADAMIHSMQSHLVKFFDRVGTIPIYSKFGFNKCTSEREVKKLYKKLSKELHPDCGGDEKQFIAMKKEYDSALRNYCA